MDIQGYVKGLGLTAFKRTLGYTPTDPTIRDIYDLGLIRKILRCARRINTRATAGRTAIEFGHTGFRA